MTHDPIYLVCGFGRCGSSLVMQMLAAGGMDCVGRWPSYEWEGGGAIPWADMGGRVVKILDLFRQPDFDLPRRPGGYRALWLDRNPDQQARSLIKFQAAVGLRAAPRADRTERRALARSLANDRAGCITKLHRIAGRAPTMMTFENILRDPVRAASALVAWTDQDLDRQAMAAQPLPRDAACLPGMLETRLLARGPGVARPMDKPVRLNELAGVRYGC